MWRKLAALSEASRHLQLAILIWLHGNDLLWDLLDKSHIWQITISSRHSATRAGDGCTTENIQDVEVKHGVERRR